MERTGAGREPEAAGQAATATDPALAAFHPAVAQWFARTLGTPTACQRAAWPPLAAGENLLLAAPTGSGKTLAAFLAALDALVREGVALGLPAETRVLYVSPLRALGNDIRRNLELPLMGIRDELFLAGEPDVDIRTAVRTGDTPSATRALMRRLPPHVLVTTPESLYILLTSESGREGLATVRTVIVDEIHAIAGSKRGAHLALSLERLERLCAPGLARIGLSATQKPLEAVARFLVGGAPGQPRACRVLDLGHGRRRDLAIELPPTPLGAVMSHAQWDEVYDRLTELVLAHRTTLVFANTRRLTERLAFKLSERLGEGEVGAHHGSLSREQRLAAEQRLKAGTLRVLVATASLELGIDIGEVDLVCQVGSTRTIATLLQRVGRAGRRADRVSKGRLFPLSRDELVEAAALLRAVEQGELDALVMPEAPLDVLAQQLVAAVACEEWDEDALFELVRRAEPYRALTRARFDAVVRMLAEGFTHRRGRGGAHLFRDAVAGRLRARRGARLTAVLNGGAIPDAALYDVREEPGGLLLGTLDEHFAIDSSVGDVFQLGNTAWRILRVETGTVWVQDAEGQPPSIPFWFGEAPARSLELSGAVGSLRAEFERRLFPGEAAEGWKAADNALEHAPENVQGNASENGLESARESAPANARANAQPSATHDGSPRAAGYAAQNTPQSTAPNTGSPDRQGALAWLAAQPGVGAFAAEQLVDYLLPARLALGALPTLDTLILERFFDASGGQQLVIHSPFGARVNRAWGLALRKRFCRSFNFELQAAATEDAVVLSLGETHSFALESVWRYLQAQSVRELLVQALLDAPMFATRWRWNACSALAIARVRAGRKVPPRLLRMQAEDLVAVVFPDQRACLENIQGDREIPDHPLVEQTLHDCLTEAMAIDTLEALLADIEAGRKRLLARDLTEPSPLAAEILAARPYAFLDDAPLEERRTLAVQARRRLDPQTAEDLGRLDPAAIERVRAEAWPQPESVDEVHDALMVLGFATAAEAEGRQGDDAGNGDSAAWALSAPAPVPPSPDSWRPGLERLLRAGRALRVRAAGLPRPLWVAVERLPELLAALERAPASAGAGAQACNQDAARPSCPALDLGPTPDLAPDLDIGRDLADGRGTPGCRRTPPDIGLGISPAITNRPHGGEGRTSPYNGLDISVDIDLNIDRDLVADDQALRDPRGEAVHIPPEYAARVWSRAEARTELLRSRLGGLGPVTAAALGAPLGLDGPATTSVLGALEAEGFVMRGRFTPGAPGEEWCERRLLARIHRATVRRLRAEVEPVSVAEYLRFLMDWQQLAGPGREGPGALERALGRLEGFEAPAGAWESALLPARVEGYAPEALDQRCLAGRLAWLKLRRAAIGLQAVPVRSTPLALVARANLPAWLGEERLPRQGLGPEAAATLQALERQGASFVDELARATGLAPTALETGLAELVARGLVNADSFAGLRVLLSPASRRGSAPWTGVDSAGRWSLLAPPSMTPPEREAALVTIARALLARWGVLCRKLLEREPSAPPWGELLRVLRRLEDRGELRGGRFLAGLPGEQFALPEALAALRASRREAARAEPRWLVVSACDPLNLTGILLPGERLPAVSAHRLVLRDGMPVASLGPGEPRVLADLAPAEHDTLQALLGRAPPAPAPAVRRYLAARGRRRGRG